MSMEEKFQALRDIIDNIGVDVEKCSQKNNRAAGQRVRKAMLDIKLLASDIRKQILESRKI